MNKKKYLDEEELLEKAIGILTEKLGPLETSRFLAITGKRRIESVKRHRKWQSGLHRTEFLQEIFNKENTP